MHQKLELLDRSRIAFVPYEAPASSNHLMCLRSLCRQRVEGVQQVIKTEQVTILSVPFLPRRIVIQLLSTRQSSGLPKINQPDVGLSRVVMDEQ